MFEALEPRLLLDAVKEPYLQAVAPDSIYVLLEADGLETTTVEYGLTSSYGSQATTESTEYTDRGNYVHNVKLPGLQPNTQYHYRALQGAYASQDYTFWTAAEAGTSYRFGFMADCRTGTAVHAVCAALMDTFDPRMIVFGGDTCYEATWNSWDREFFLAEQQALNAEVPFALATGNHEGWNALTRAYTQGYDGDGNGYYSFDYGDAHFLILNTQVSYSEGSDQWNFAAADLAANSQPWTFVSYHKPAYCAGGHGEDAGMKAMSTALFEPNNVDMTLTGHSHLYQHNLVNGIHHMVIGSTGAPLVDPGSASYVVYTEKTYSLGVFDMTATTLDLTTYRDDGTVIETLHFEKDLTPPTTPADLSAVAVSHAQIDLTWTPADDPESGIDHYNVYRDGQFLDTAPGAAYSDTTVGELTAYTYRVSAVNGDMLEGAQSDPASETTPADTVPPAIDAVSAPDETTVRVVYDEPVEQASAENVANYAVDQGIAVSAAVLQADTRTVELTVSTLTEDITYTLTVNNVRDRAATPNTIAPDTQETFVYLSWEGGDIGAVGAAGSHSEAGGVWTIEGSGADIWGTADEFHYVYQALAGDGDIVARVVSVENTNAWAKAGVMIRETLAAGSTHAMTVVTPGNGVSFQRRLVTDGTSSSTTNAGLTAPYWVKIVREGDTFTSYRSPDGGDWTLVGSDTVAMGTNVHVGMAVTSHSDGVLCTAEFDNVTVTEYGVNLPPVALDDAYDAVEDTPLAVDAAGGVLANDYDPESQPITAVNASDPPNGSVVLNADGSFDYTPDADFFGIDSFTYQAFDGVRYSDAATVTIAIAGTPDAPVANDDVYDAAQDQTLTVDVPGVLGNDTDADNDTLSAIKVADPAHGAVTLNSDGSFQYTPDPGYSGADSFTYKANDGGLDSNVATVDITIAAGEQPFYAVAEATAMGTVSGSHLDTQAGDDVYEALTEILDGKKSMLEHTWTFELAGGSTITFYVEAYHDGTEDDFKFQYSTDGGTWTDMVTVTKTADDDAAQTYAMPGGLSGSVYVRTIDTNRAANKKTLDTLYVDRMYIGAIGDGPQLPVVSIQATDAAAAEETEDPGTFTVTRTGSTSGALTVYYGVGGTAVGDDYYEALSGTAVIPDGSASADVTVTPVDDALEEGAETVVLTIAADAAYNVGSPDNAAVTIADNDIMVYDDYATSEATTSGTVSGSYLDTLAADDVYEALTEVPGERCNVLEHTWTFDVTGGSSVTFYVEAWHTGTTDDFVFQYSTDGATWTDMVTVTKAADDDTAESCELPSALSGTVYVRVLDTNRLPNKKDNEMDTLYVDEMFIRSQ